MHQIKLFQRKNRARSESQLSKQLYSNHQLRSIKASLANEEKLEEPNLIDKLLLPPIKKSSSEEKRKKYYPKFEKPDLQTLIKDKNSLKKELHESSITNNQLKVKIRELESKLGEMKGKMVKNSQKNMETEKANSSVYTIILKNKVEELNLKLQEKERQIDKLKKLPNTKIFQQNSIEKEHLILETIRLAAKIAALEQKSNENRNIETMKQKDKESRVEETPLKSRFGANSTKTDNMNRKNEEGEGNFQKNFIKILKQENEKVKGTVRLLENDKTMMKASLSIQVKEYKALEKRYEEVCKIFNEKVKEIEMLTEENKNLLFKKAEQFNFEVQYKQEAEIQRLTKVIEDIRSEKRKVEEQNELLTDDNKHLKDKEKLKNMEILDIEQKYETLKLEMAEIENREGNQPHGKAVQFKEQKDYQVSQPVIAHKVSKQHRQTLGQLKKNVKFRDITLPLLIISSLKKDKILKKYDQIFDLEAQMRGNCQTNQILVTFRQLHLILCSKPLQLPIEAGLRLSSYIFEDHLEVVDNVPYIRLSTALSILKATLNQFTELLSSQEVVRSWTKFLSKRKKFYNDFQKIQSESLTSDSFFQMVLNSRLSEITEGQVLYMQLMGFDRGLSINEIILSKSQLLGVLKTFMNGENENSGNIDSGDLSLKQNSLFTSMMTSAEKIERNSGRNSILKKNMCDSQNKNRHRLSLNWTPKIELKGRQSKRFSQVYQINGNEIPSILGRPAGEIIPSITENSDNSSESSSSSASPSCLESCATKMKSNFQSEASCGILGPLSQKPQNISSDSVVEDD